MDFNVHWRHSSHIIMTWEGTSPHPPWWSLDQDNSPVPGPQVTDHWPLIDFTRLWESHARTRGVGTPPQCLSLTSDHWFQQEVRPIQIKPRPQPKQTAFWLDMRRFYILRWHLENSLVSGGRSFIRSDCCPPMSMQHRSSNNGMYGRGIEWMRLY